MASHTNPRATVNSSTILTRENDNVVMMLDSVDAARAASISPPDQASVSAIHASASTLDDLASAPVGGITYPARSAHTFTPTAVVPSSVPDSDPPPPYSPVSSL